MAAWKDTSQHRYCTEGEFLQELAVTWVNTGKLFNEESQVRAY